MKCFTFGEVWQGHDTSRAPVFISEKHGRFGRMLVGKEIPRLLILFIVLITNAMVLPVVAYPVNLVWDDNSVGETQFRIERKESADEFAFLANVPANSTNFTDTTAVAGCIYRVRAENGQGCSPWSNVASDGLAPTAPVPLGYWSLREGNGMEISDLSGNGYDGIMTGSPLPSWIVSPVGDYALQFDGLNGYVAVANFPTNWSAGMTLAAWVNLNSFANNGRIVARDPNPAKAWGLGVESSGDWNFAIPTSDTSRLNFFVPINGATNRWLHLAGVYDPVGPGIKVYIDGTLARQTNGVGVPAAIFDTDASVDIGRRGTTEVFDGKIDEVRVYAQVLNTREIAALAAPRFAQAVFSNGSVNLNWIGSGELEWAASIDGPWAAIIPTPSSPVSLPIELGLNRFFRLKRAVSP